MKNSVNNDVIEDYGWSSAEGPHSGDYINPRIIEILRRLNVDRVLDIGSGNGKLCSIIDSSGFSTVGIEPDIKGVEIAKKQYPDIAFYDYGVHDDPARLIRREALFDVVVSTEVIEHLYSPHLLILYAEKVLKEDGYLVISTPYHGYLKNLALSIFNKWDDHHTALWHGGHIKFWSRNTLKRLLQENGFSEIEFSGVGRAPYLWKSMVLVAKKDEAP